MALGNWTSVMWDEDGQPADQLRSPSGVVVRIYKDCIEVEDELAWRDDCRYVRPQVMSVSMGRLTYRDVEIVALRGPREGVYAFAWCLGAGWDEDGKFKGVVGIGVYSFPAEGSFAPVGVGEMCWLLEQVQEESSMPRPGWSMCDVPHALVVVLTEKVREAADR